MPLFLDPAVLAEAAPVGDELGCPTGVFFIEVRPHHSAPLLVALAQGIGAHRLKFAAVVYKCLHGATPSCFADELCLLVDLSPQRRLRSAPFSSLIVRHTRLLTISNRAFPVAAALVWNGLPQHVTSASSVYISQISEDSSLPALLSLIAFVMPEQ